MTLKRIVMSSDSRGLEPNATVVSSLLAHTDGPVHVRLFTRDLPTMVLESGRLTLEVIPTPEHLRLEGGVPAHVNAGGTFDRIAAIPYCTDWERALVLDYDQVVIGNPTELFEMDLGGALAAGCLWGRSLGEACREWFGRNLPKRWAGCAAYRYFYMGPVLNLKALREDGAYERFVEFTQEAGMEEQIGLHVACQDRIIAVNPGLNVITQWDGISEDSRVLHFTGPRKPWNHPELPGAQFWRAHETTWEELTCGLWNTQEDAANEDGRWADPAVAEAIKALRRPGMPCRVLELGGWDFDRMVTTTKVWMNDGSDRWIKIFRPHVDSLALEQAIRRFTTVLEDLGPRTEILDGNSAEILGWMLTQDESWENLDAVILHAPRRREGFLSEACMAWKLLRPGGVMVIHPVAQLPGKVGRRIFEETLEGFVASVADGIMEFFGGQPRMLRKADAQAEASGCRLFPAVDRSNPIDLLAHMIETCVETDLVRHGPCSDGGYHVPAGVNYDKVITIGVGNDIAFESDYARENPGTHFELFDHTVCGLPGPLPNSVFHRIGAGFGECLKPLAELLDGRLATFDTVLLKIDCEGAEWHCGLDQMDFDSIHTLLIEIHSILSFDEPARVAKVMAALADRFVLVHACPNNYEDSGQIQGHILTNCLELTLVNRSRVPDLLPRTQDPPPFFRNAPHRPPARLEIRKRGKRNPCIMTA